MILAAVECIGAGRCNVSFSSGGRNTAADGAWKARSESRTAWICVASSLNWFSTMLYVPSTKTYLVGEIMIAPMWCRFMGSSRRNSLSTTGMRNDSVLPLPVTAYGNVRFAQIIRSHGFTSTTTSLLPANNGMVLA